jgi:hypothetical protein
MPSSMVFDFISMSQADHHGSPPPPKSFVFSGQVNKCALLRSLGPSKLGGYRKQRGRGTVHQCLQIQETIIVLVLVLDDDAC